jgi:hypothetical protein
MSEARERSSKRELAAAFGIGVSAALLAGAALGLTRQAQPPSVEEKKVAQGLPSADEQIPENVNKLRASCEGGVKSDFEINAAPLIQGKDVSVEFKVANQTTTDMDLATVTELTALDGTVIAALSPSAVKSVAANGTFESRDTESIPVPDGYYTLWVTALALEKRSKDGREHSSQAVIYLHSDGKRVRQIDYTEWYLNSGAVEFGPADQEKN